MPRRFILIEPDPLVCIDLKGALTDAYPDCRIDIGDHLQATQGLIDDIASDATIIVKGSLLAKFEDVATSIEKAADTGCRIVALGTAAGIFAPAHTLDIPFTTEQLLQAVSSETLGASK